MLIFSNQPITIINQPQPTYAEESTMGIKDLIEGRLDTYKVDPSIIIIDEGFNVRIPGEDLDDYIRWLADSIKSEGVKEALNLLYGR